RAGLGCIHAVNGDPARALLGVFQLDPPFTLCCDGCKGAGLPDDKVPGSSCGVTLPRGSSPAASEIVILNVNGPSTVYGNGGCGRKGSPKPIQKLLLHEMLHAAGLDGVGGHAGSGSTEDPHTHETVAERDFLPDPVYGCEKLCFGTSRTRTSVSCLACSQGSIPASGAPLITSSATLTERLRDAEVLA